MRTAGITIAMLAITASVQAQQADTRHPAPTQAIGPVPATRPRVAYAGTPAPPPPPPVTVIVGQPVYVFNNGYAYPGYANNGYVVTDAPYVVQTDGSVLVNFGNGYQRVLVQCVAARQAPANPYGLDALGRIPDPPGIAALRPGAQGQVAGTMPARNSNACYRINSLGRPQIAPQ